MYSEILVANSIILIIYQEQYIFFILYTRLLFNKNCCWGPLETITIMLLVNTLHTTYRLHTLLLNDSLTQEKIISDVIWFTSSYFYINWHKDKRCKINYL